MQNEVVALRAIFEKACNFESKDGELYKLQYNDNTNNDNTIYYCNTYQHDSHAFPIVNEDDKGERIPSSQLLVSQYS